MIIFPLLHLYVLLPSIEIAGEGLEGINGHITYHCTLVNHGYAGKLNVTFIYEGENGEIIIRNKIVHRRFSYRDLSNKEIILLRKTY